MTPEFIIGKEYAEAQNTDVKEEDNMTGTEEIVVVSTVEEITEETAEATEATEVAVPEEKLPKFSDVVNPADEDRTILLVTATRNKNTDLLWCRVFVTAGTDPKAVFNIPEDRKLIIAADERYIDKFVADEKTPRGMASTIADLTAKYAKVAGVTVLDKVQTAVTIFKFVLDDIKAGNNNGTIAATGSIDVDVEEIKTEEVAE